MQAVLDPNVIISGLLSPGGATGRLLQAFQQGELDIIVSPQLLGELTRALAYPKLQSRIPRDQAAAALAWLAETATSLPDPDQEPPVRSTDPADDYLIALAHTHRLALISGDKHLLDLSDQMPVFSPRNFLELLDK